MGDIISGRARAKKPAELEIRAKKTLPEGRVTRFRTTEAVVRV
jgi:hypothetical protein